MKKIASSVVLFFLVSFAYTQAFDKDTVHINFGVGLGWPYHFEKMYANMWSLPAISASIERGLYTFDSVATISVGIGGTYKYLENKRLNTLATWHNFVVGASIKCNLHYFNNIKIIPYAGVFGGINAIKFNDNFYGKSTEYPTNYNGAFPLIYAFAGAKYISKPSFGVYGEVSYGFSYLTLGLYKLL